MVDVIELKVFQECVVNFLCGVLEGGLILSVALDDSDRVEQSQKGCLIPDKAGGGSSGLLPGAGRQQKEDQQQSRKAPHELRPP